MTMAAAAQLLPSRRDIAGLAYANEQLTKLNVASLELSRIRDAEGLYAAIPRLLSQTLDFHTAVLNIDVDGSLNMLGMFIANDEDGSYKKRFVREIRAGSHAPPPPLRQCIRDNTTIVVRDSRQWPQCFRAPKSVVLTPLRVDGKAVGLLLACLEQDGRDIDDHDVQRFEAFANMAGLALQNVALMANLERKVEERTRHLRDAQARLVQSEKMAALGMLVAGVAHEINTPMGAIRSTHDTIGKALDRIEKQIDSDCPRATRTMKVIRDGLAVIGEGSERVNAIVTRLRTFSRLDRAELEHVDLHDGIEDTLALTKHQLNGVTIVRDYGELPAVLCQPGRINQIFMNLLVNARQAIGGQGNITIRTRYEADRVSIAISDDGCGIDDAHLARVFDPGFTTKGVGVGTGLGLSICFNIAGEHDGELSVESRVDHGTTFTLSLPAG
jgi:signal transduction histidine kinase